MAKVEQCPGFETFGADVKTAREKLGISRRELAEKIGVDPQMCIRDRIRLICSTVLSMGSTGTVGFDVSFFANEITPFRGNG